MFFWEIQKQGFSLKKHGFSADIHGYPEKYCLGYNRPEKQCFSQNSLFLQKNNVFPEKQCFSGLLVM